MKKKNIELDVDFIGGQKSLTVEEELVLSEYFKKQKPVLKKRTLTTGRLTSKKRDKAKS